MKRTYFLAATAILFWSSVATVTKLLMGSMTSMQVLSVSSLFAFLFLLCTNAATGRLALLRTYRVRDYLITVLVGLPGTFLYYMFYYAGASRLPASQAFIINYLWPIMSVVFACVILKDRHFAFLLWGDGGHGRRPFWGWQLFASWCSLLRLGRRLVRGVHRTEQ